MRITLGAYVYSTLLAGVAAATLDLSGAAQADGPTPMPALAVPSAVGEPSAESTSPVPGDAGLAAGGPQTRDTALALAQLAPDAEPVPDTAAELTPDSAGQSDADAEAPLASVLSLSIADSLLTEPYAIGTERRTVLVESGDTLLGVLGDHGAPRNEAHALIDALETEYDPRDLQIGQELTLILEHTGHDTTLVGLEIMPSVDATVQVRRDTGDGSYAAERLETALETRPVAAAGAITSSLAADTSAAGVPYRILVPLVRAYSYTVDFQRDIRDGDAFEILFEREYFEDGAVARDGDIVFARLQLGDRDLPVYRFETAEGYRDYFDRDGLSVRRALLRTPIDGARLSSGFGYRRHPILGYTRMHQGVDFAAPTGTPIYAAGDGVVDRIGPNAGYGNYIRIRHNGQISTAYAHLSRYARDVGQGARVRQGQVIGYVGSTGLSTGPHLHYEVLVNGAAVNPLSVDLPTGLQLTGQDMVAFRAHVDATDALFRASLRQAAQLAASPDETEPTPEPEDAPAP